MLEKNKLNHEETLVLKYRAGGYDYKMIANHIRTSEDEVRKIEKSAIKKLEASLKC